MLGKKMNTLISLTTHFTLQYASYISKKAHTLTAVTFCLPITEVPNFQLVTNAFELLYIKLRRTKNI